MKWNVFCWLLQLLSFLLNQLEMMLRLGLKPLICLLAFLKAIAIAWQFPHDDNKGKELDQLDLSLFLRREYIDWKIVRELRLKELLVLFRDDQIGVCYQVFDEIEDGHLTTLDFDVVLSEQMRNKNHELFLQLCSLPL